jgi:Lipocalin-like domain
MRNHTSMHVAVASSIACLFLCPPVLAQDNAAKLYGSWKLISVTQQIVGENGPPVEPYGPNPKGYLILLPNGRMMAHLGAPDRKPAESDADRAALLQSMNAYTGTYTVEGDKWTTIVDLAHNEIFKGQPQVRYFKVDGDKLFIRVPEQPSATFPGKRSTASLEWVRER